MNLMATVMTRSKFLMLRVGGNSQEQSVLVDGGLPDGAMVEKGAIGSSRVRFHTFIVSFVYSSL